jgi:U4/U6.U5 tri-snRNP component SNU23
LINTGQTTEVKRATVEEVRERIDFYIRKKEELEKERVTTLDERLQLREEEREKELEERRKKRRDETEKKRVAKEEAEKIKTEYGDDVRIEGEHDEDDMLAQMGISGFGSSKK